MSADNQIAIVKFDDGYRVAHIQAPENINHTKDKQEWEDYMNYNFGGCIVYETQQEAMLEAQRQEDDYGYVEYGKGIYTVKNFIPTP